DAAISELKAMENDINDFKTAREKELQNTALKLRNDIVKEITAQITALDRSQTDLIFDASGQSLNGVPVFVFAPANADMTLQVVSGLNKSAKEPLVPVRSLPIALVDMNDTFKQYSKTKDAEAKINEAKDAAKREYDDRANAYKSKLDALKDMPNGGPRNNAIAEIKAMEKE